MHETKGGDSVESTGLEMLVRALSILRMEAEGAPSRELSLSITNAEQALMWRAKVSVPGSPGAGERAATPGGTATG